MSGAGKVYVGVGHGGRDPGACAGALRESDWNLQLALLVGAELRARGVDTRLSRTADVDFNTAAKVADANAWGADLVLDIHHNAGGGAGFEIYRSQAADGSQALAGAISDEMDAIGRRNRGVKTNVQNGVDYFGIIRQTRAPAVLIEYGFVDNAEDVALLTDPAHQRAWAQATARGVCAVLAAAPGSGEGVQAAGESTAGTLYRVQVGAFRSESNARALVEQLRQKGFDAFVVRGG